MISFIKEKVTAWDKLKAEKRPIYIYGMGDGALKIMSVFRKCGIQLKGIFASDEFVRGQSFRGFTVERYADIVSRLGEDVLIVIAFASERPEVLARFKELAEAYETLAPHLPLFDEPETVTISFNIGDAVLNINGEKIEVVAPYIAGEGTTLVPLRVISEAFGAEVTWDGETKSVKIVDGTTEIALQIESNTAVVNGEEKTLDAAPELTNDTTMVPLRFISETLGAEVGYVHETQSITVSR